ncbi:glycosyltransferase family 2 protein [Patescibacteria group bacterium]
MSWWNPLNRPVLYRLLEILPAALSWTILILCVVLAFIVPVWVAIFVVCFDLYWLIRVSYLTYHLVAGYRQMNKNVKVDWLAKVRKIKKRNWSEYYHLVVFPVVMEVAVIESTFAALAKANYPLDKFIVVLACEDKFWSETGKVALEMKRRYAKVFRHFEITRHPPGLPGEIPGKGSNEVWAVKHVKKYIDQQKMPYEKIMVSVFDIDTQINPEYFGRLAHAYLTHPRPERASYQPIPTFNNNIWDAPSLVRVIATSTTFWQLMEQGRPERLVTFSSHSMSFKALVDVGFWATDHVSEDSRIFWQCLLHYKGDYETVPLFFPVSMDACLTDTYRGSLVNQYKQQRRWAWGTENLPYAIYNFIKQGKTFPLGPKLLYSWYLIDGAVSWATSAIIIAIVGWLPLLVGGEVYSDTVFAQSLPQVAQILMTFAMIGMIASMFVTLLVLPPRPKKYTTWRHLIMIFQWVLLPISTIFFGSFVALDAQTRLMLGKYMGFFLTPKARVQKTGKASVKAETSVRKSLVDRT